MAAVLEGLKGESPIADICHKYQISESLHYRWGTSFRKLGVADRSSKFYVTKKD
jgi:hypothetical protein